ncbi:hypothetical protein ABN034_30670 [Actinopolymorpha sp. B11F2]|uniref:hypothetical protein n=1 Tax=Actinopolymorpha sp. B11F2 TaxID=3160862 RepID=UPI0032E4FCDC
MPARARLMPALVAGVLVVFGLVGGCAGGSDGTGSSDSTPPPVKRLTVKIADGEVSPNAARVEVADGTPIEITVTSDVADRLHVHGYDEEVAVEPDKPGTLEFVADEAGRFEIELHDADRLVYQLVVLP